MAVAIKPERQKVIEGYFTGGIAASLALHAALALVLLSSHASPPASPAVTFLDLRQTEVARPMAPPPAAAKPRRAPS